MRERGFCRGKTHDRLILKTILQKNTVLKLMRDLASSLPVTSFIKKYYVAALRGEILTRWNSSLVETSSTKFFKFFTLARTHTLLLKKNNLTGTRLC